MVAGTNDAFYDYIIRERVIASKIIGRSKGELRKIKIQSNHGGAV